MQTRSALLFSKGIISIHFRDSLGFYLFSPTSPAEPAAAYLHTRRTSWCWSHSADVLCLRKLPLKHKCLLDFCCRGGLRKAAWLRLQMHNLSYPFATFPSLLAKQALFWVHIQNTSQTLSWDLSTRVSEGRETWVLELFDLMWLVWQKQARRCTQKPQRQQTEGAGVLQQGTRKKRLKTVFHQQSGKWFSWQEAILIKIWTKMRIFSGKLSNSKLINYRELDLHAWKKEISPA